MLESKKIISLLQSKWFLFCFFLIASLANQTTYFTHDSFHYMQLSLEPKFGDTHPVLFGYYLKLLTWIGGLIHIQGMGLEIYKMLQAFLSAFICLFIALEVRKVPQFSFKDQKIFAITKSVCSLTTYLILIPSFIVLKSSVWTEIIFTSMILITIIALRKLEPKQQSSRNWIYWLILILVPGLSYHIRYQGALLLIALPMTLIFHFWLRREKKYLGIAIGSLGCLLALNGFIKTLGDPMQNGHLLSLHNMAKSYMCFWRCDTNLLSSQCQKEEDRAVVQSNSCSTVTVGLQHFPISIDENTIKEAIKLDGPWKFISWAIFMPIKYFFDQHTVWGLEIGSKRFQDDDGKTSYPKTEVYFQNQFNDPNGSRTKLFGILEDYIRFLNFDLKIFNLLGLLLFITSLPAIFINYKKLSGLYVNLITIGNVALVALLNAHTPWRFLTLMIFLGVINLASALASLKSQNPPKGKQ